MENREQQILSEIKSLMSSVMEQVDKLQTKMQELQQLIEPQDVDVVIDLDADEEDTMWEPAAETVVAEAVTVVEQVIVPAVEIDPVAEVEETEQEVETESEVEVEIESGVESEEEAQIEEVAVEQEESVFEPAAPVVVPAVDDDLPFGEPEEVKEKPKAVIDLMTARQAWRTDMPGAHVNDIRSAIALMDRILFINVLFNEDPMAFQNAVAKINSMDTLQQVVDYLTAEHGDWDFDSEVVYRFMMAVRRRVR